jgi:putative sterol carrier protein
LLARAILGGGDITIQFPSEAWAQRFVEELNQNQDYAKAARNWEGSFLFVVTAGPQLEREFLFFMDLWHGRCRDWTVLTDRNARKADFTIEGPLENWIGLLQGEIDPIKGLMARKFKLRGSMFKVIRNVGAASELAKNSARVPTEFPD